MRNVLMIIGLLMITGTYVLTSAEAPNAGDRLVAMQSADDPSVSFRIWFKVGSQDDPKGKEGLAALTAAMISDGGTASRSYEQILEALFPMASSYGCNVSTEMMVFTGRVHKDNLDAYYNLFIDQLLNPAFPQDVFDRLKQNMLNYLTTTLKYASDEELGKAVLYESIFDKTPYGHLTSGTVSGLHAITLQDVKDFYTTYFNRNNFVIGIAGGYSDDFLKVLQTDLQKLNDGKENVTEKVVPAAFEGYHVTIAEKAANATAISFGFPITVVRGSREWYALAIANSWFGEHRNSSSHLYQVIREERGLNYGDYSYIEHFPNGSRRQMPPVNVARKQHIFEVWIRPVPNEARHFALRAAMRELDALINNGMSEADFKLTKGFLKNYVLHYAPDTYTRLGYALDDVFYGIKEGHISLYRKMMDEITLEEVNAAIKKHLSMERFHIAVVTNNAEEFKNALVNNSVSSITYSTPKPDEVLQEDKDIEVYKLPIKSENVRIIPVEKLFQ
ncbi:zinc protease [uncultured bacterium]|nr:zinc protease [uncultured bacterium]